MRQFAGLVASIDHEHIVLDDQCAMFFEHVQRFAVIAHHHANDAVIHCIARRDSINIDFGFGQRVRQARQGPWPIIQKDGELLRDLHSLSPLRLRFWCSVPCRKLADPGTERQPENHRNRNGLEAVKKLENSLKCKKSLLIIKDLLRRILGICNFFTAS